MGKPEPMAAIPIPIPVLTHQGPQPRDLGGDKIGVGCWNIRRGLLIREQELKEIIKSSSLNIIFLTETDTTWVNSDTDYKINGFKTIVQLKKSESDVTRILCLVDESLANQVLIRNDLSSNDFPSLWIEVENTTGKNIICGGFYREWAPGGDNSIPAQTKSMQVFTSQIEKAAAENKSIIITGDANLCSEKWDTPDFKHKTVADELRETLTQCGLINIPLGYTYTADRLDENGSVISSALDHFYASEAFAPHLKTQKLTSTATDHVPIAAFFVLNSKSTPNKTTKQKTITKRTMKNFTKTRWIDALRNRDWTRIGSIQEINEQTEEFTKEINGALDECAPYRRFKVRQNFKPGLSKLAKEIMGERDLTRKKMGEASEQERPILQAKYKQLRNRTINQIRKDTVQMNGDKIASARNEGETWRIVNDILKPRNENPITINTTRGDISDEQEVADTFNEYFVTKIAKLKTSINPNQMKDPLERIKAKMENKNLKFRIRTVSPLTVQKLMKKMAKKE